MADVEIIIDNTDKAMTNMQDGIERALEAIGAQCENYAKMLCPVDTGNLRNSINHAKENSNTVVVGTNVEYAIYVHEGHKTPSGGHVAPRRFLRDAAVNHTEEYKRIAEAAIKGALG